VTPPADAGESLDTSAVVNVSTPIIDVSAPTNVDAGAPSVDTGATASVSVPTMDVPASAAVDAGPVQVGADDAAVTAGITSGPAPAADLGVDAEVESGTGHTGITVVVGASHNQQEVTVGSANAAEAVANSGHGNGSDDSNGGGNGNHGADHSVDLGVTLGLEDDGATASATDNTGTDKPGKGPPADVVDVIDGLIRHRGKK
jgi:hypothetical protein